MATFESANAKLTVLGNDDENNDWLFVIVNKFVPTESAHIFLEKDDVKQLVQFLIRDL